MTARLTARWRQAGRAATLGEHTEIYGPLPRPGRAGHGSGGLIDAVTAAGLTGRGGAGFVTGTKMRSVASRRKPAAVIANGMEGEPASEKDQALMSRAPHLVLDGAALAAEAVGADVAHVCLPRTRQWLTGLLADAVAQRQRANLDRVRFVLHELPQHYVSGEETALVRWLNGGVAKPVATPPRPAEKGVRRRPTLVDNVETLAQVALIARFGPAWFRQAGHPHAPGTMLVTVSGAVAEPGVYEIELGTPVGQVLAMGGASEQAAAVLLGGYGGSWHDPRTVAAVPMTGHELGRVGAAPGAGVIVALPPGACVLAETSRVLGYLARQGAGQCGSCAFGLPAIADDFAQLVSGRAADRALDRLERRLGVIPGRGACRHPDGAARLASSALRAFTADVHAHASGRPCVSGHRGHPRPAALPIPRPLAEGEWQ
jgi:NADH:ubiquinone oxidoreductase subunit F (NADH-binding)